MNTEATNHHYRRLRWRCRRGMRELDVALLRYLELCYAEAPAAHRKIFEALLSMQDPVIWGLLTGREKPREGDLADVIEAIRAAASNPTCAV